jgi:tRNA(adenine34) deaminase
LPSLHEQWMNAALREAQRAFDADEVPVGAVVVLEGKIIGRGYNQVERLKDPTAHAEMIAITAASNYLQSKKMEKCTLYVSMEPCPMCAGAIVLAKIPTLVFGVYDLKAGACGTLYNITEDKRLNHTVHVVGGICDVESEALLKEFFSKARISSKVKN